jgi:hypothetical protein
MSEMDFEAQLRAIAARMEYPRTPDIADSVRARLRPSMPPRFLSKAAVWSLTIVLILVTSLMLIPPARAAIIEFIQIGVVRIFRAEPTPISPPNQELPVIPITATPSATSQPLIPLLKDLVGETTLENAQKVVKYPLLLPSYPGDLGRPDYVFVQKVEGAMAILVWLDPQNPDHVLMSLHFIPAGSWVLKKMDAIVIQTTSVDGHDAVWTTGPYPMILQNGDIQYMRMIDGHVLIWENEDVTYRLETDLSLEEAIRIAESLQPIQ